MNRCMFCFEYGCGTVCRRQYQWATWPKALTPMPCGLCHRDLRVGHHGIDLCIRLATTYGSAP